MKPRLTPRNNGTPRCLEILGAMPSLVKFLLVASIIPFLCFAFVCVSVCVRSLWLKGPELSLPPPWLLALLPPWLLAEMWFVVLFASAMACGYGLQLSRAAAAHKKAHAKKAMMKVKKALKRRKAKAKAKTVSNFLANHQVFDDDHTGLSMAEMREQMAEMQRNLERQEGDVFDASYNIAVLFHHVPAANEEVTRMWHRDRRAEQGDRVILG